MNKLRFMFITVVMSVLTLPSQSLFASQEKTIATEPSVQAVDVEQDIVSTDPFEPGKWIDKAVAMLEEQMAKSPDKRIPNALLKNAKCVVLFPEVLQAGISFGGKFGRGMASCYDSETGEWGTPVFLRLISINWGMQLGGQVADVIMLVMNDKGLDALFGGKPLVGAGVGIAAGPVGRDATANIDVLLETPIVTYTRSKGLYVGAIIEGATLTPAKTVNRELYGEKYPDARSLLFMEVSVPPHVSKLQQALSSYTSLEWTGEGEESDTDVESATGEAADANVESE